MNVFLANNSGLGDYILMNGATRYVAAQPEVDNVHLLCIGTHNKFTNVKWMYRDDPNIIVYPEPPHNSLSHARRKIKRHGKRFARQFPNLHKRAFFWSTQDWWAMMPHFGLDREKNCWTELFYAAHGAPYSARHENFHLERDLDREGKLLNSLNLPSEYAFCSNTSSRGSYAMKPSSKLPVVSPRDLPDDLIFDWMGVIENATEVHTVDTSWFHLIKQMRLDKPKYFYHVRNYSALQNHFTSCYINDEYDNGWTILDKMRG